MQIMKSASHIIGTYIKKQRIQQGLSIAALSKKAGISASQISLIERGIHSKNGKALSISLTSLEMIAKGLQICIPDILEESGYYDYINNKLLTKISFTSNTNSFINHYYALNNENKALVNEYINTLLETQEDESSYSR